jgi:hypothetical protein
MGDWLGTWTVAPRLREYWDFGKARAFVHTLGLKSTKEWSEYCKAGEKPDGVPLTPRHVYEKRGWVSMGDWLGSGAVANQFRTFRSFRQARSFVHSLRLKSQKDWRHYCQSGKKPDDIPANPFRCYKSEGWVSFGDWLGTGNVASYERQFLRFEEARDFARGLGLKSAAQWREYCKSGRKPDDVPADPGRVYADDGWAGMGDWLGY